MAGAVTRTKPPTGRKAAAGSKGTKDKQGQQQQQQKEADGPKYNENLVAPIEEGVYREGPRAGVHRAEWGKVMEGEPVQINPSVGDGFRVMSVREWAARWKRNDDFPACLACGGDDTREHHFVQTWCRGKKVWESECLCLDCHAFSWRSYADPDFRTPEEFEKARWGAIMRDAA